jgi:hypothetical protein
MFDLTAADGIVVFVLFAIVLGSFAPPVASAEKEDSD